MSHFVTVTVEDKPGVLARVVGQFARRAVNIRCLVARLGQAPHAGTITVEFDLADAAVDNLVKSIARLIDVIDIRVLETDPEPHHDYRPERGREGERCRGTR